MTDELYINGSLVDTEDVEIVRTYKTPFFSDVTQLSNDGTLTIRLPKTTRNTAVFEACFRTDFVSDLPYNYLYADYYFNGLLMFKNAEVRILNVDTHIEIQCVYGINREKYLTLFQNKLNEIIIDGVNISVLDWVVTWNPINMYYSNGKYKYIDYISVIRTSDKETINGVVQPKLEVPEPFIGHEKQMAVHPFIKCENIHELININGGYGIDFTKLNEKITNKGIILNDVQTIFNPKQRVINVPNATYTDAYTFEMGNFTDDSGIISITDAEWGEHTFKLLSGNNDDKIKINFSVDFSANTSGFRVGVVNHTYQFNYTEDNGIYHYTGTIEVEISPSFSWFSLYFGNEPISSLNVISGTITINYSAPNDYFSLDTGGSYNCIANMPKITEAEFIQQMLIHTGLFLGYNSAGLLKTFSLDTFKDNLDNGDVVDWSGRVSNIRKGTFQFNDNAQKNYIKFNNDKDLTTDRKETIVVNDKTLITEKDLYVLEFDSPLGAVGEKSEMILYEQTVKRSGDTGVSFENKYVGDSWNNGFVINDAGIARNIDVVGDTYYDVYKKLTERPLVVECDVNLSIYESANVDFEKPIYCDEIGRYCLLLELQAPKYDVCVAKLLVVTQKL